MGLSEFQNKKFQTTFHHLFKVKNGNFKTRDFSPLIERVLAGMFNNLIYKSTKMSSSSIKEIDLESNKCCSKIMVICMYIPE